MSTMAWDAWMNSDERKIGLDLDVMNEEEKKTSPWLVRRNGGRKDLPWRIVFSSMDEAKAMEHYALLVRSMRQGGVELIHPSGARVAWQTAPRLRAKW